MVAYTYSRVAALNFNTTPPGVAKSATGSVYAVADTTFTTPLNMTMVVGGSVVTTISSDAQGFFPDFTVADRTSVVWKQASSSFTTVLTTSDPVPGPQGAAGTPGATGAQGPRGDLATWQTATFYPLNQVIANPSGDLVKVTTAHTSGASYDATKFGWVNNNAANLTGTLPEASVPARLAEAALDADYAPIVGSTNYARVFAVDAAYGDGLLDATAHIQSKIDAANAAGGGVVAIPPGQYRLTRSDDIASVTLKSNVVLRGSGTVTHLFLDPATPADADRYHVLRIGTPTTGADDIIVEDLKLTANHAAIAGGSILGIGARHTDNKLATSGNITVQRCHIYDSQIAICASKDGGDSLEEGADRLAAQFSNWLVRDNVLDLCGNKMVEFSETNGARCVGNRMTRCFSGPQAIFFSRNIVFEKNYVNYTDSGMNIAAGAHDIDIIGNTFEAHSSIVAGVANGAIFFRTEPTSGRTYDCYNIRSRGNVYRDKYTTAKRVMKFQTRAENTAGLYRLISFIGDTFDGTIHFDDVTSPAKTTITEFLFSDCTIEGDFFNDASSTLVLYSDNELRGNRFRKSGGYTISASNWAITGNRFKSALTIAAGATANVVQNNRVVGGVTDNGTSTVLTDNVAA